MRREVLRISLCFAFTGVLGGSIYATKPEVPISDCTERAEVVAVVTITSSSRVSKSAQDKKGNWSFERRRLMAGVKRSLKGNVAKHIIFECDGLTFEEANDYIVFLIRAQDHSGSPMVCIDLPSRLVKATPESEKQIQRIIEKQEPHKK